jgi:hypothetical protein
LKADSRRNREWEIKKRELAALPSLDEMLAIRARLHKKPSFQKFASGMPHPGGTFQFVSLKSVTRPWTLRNSVVLLIFLGNCAPGENGRVMTLETDFSETYAWKQNEELPM